MSSSKQEDLDASDLWYLIKRVVAGLVLTFCVAIIYIPSSPSSLKEGLEIRVLKHVLGLAAGVFCMVIIDAFLLKYKVGFTFAGALDYFRRSVVFLFSSIGYAMGRMMNIWQLLWDILDALWNIIKPYMPVEELAKAREAMYEALSQTGFLLLFGWVDELCSGFHRALMKNWQLSLLTTIAILAFVKHLTK